MSLVVARIFNGQFEIHSDSRLTRQADLHPSQLTGILKTVLFDSKTCISFAGGVDDATEALSKVFEFDDLPISNLIEILLGANIKSINQTDFIVASILTGDSKLYKITNGKVETELQSAWIGDYEAFNYFQSKLLELPGKDRTRTSIGDSFKQVLNNGNFPTVGDYHIHVVARGNRFEYNHSISINLGPQTLTLQPNVLKTLPDGTAGNGSFSMNYMVSNDEGKQAVGVHYGHGRFGVLLYPRCSLSPKVIRDVSCSEFACAVQKQFGVALTGILYR